MRRAQDIIEFKAATLQMLIAARPQIALRGNAPQARFNAPIIQPMLRLALGF
jgi:hypothetical protein